MVAYRVPGDQAAKQTTPSSNLSPTGTGCGNCQSFAARPAAFGQSIDIHIVMLVHIHRYMHSRIRETQQAIFNLETYFHVAYKTPKEEEKADDDFKEEKKKNNKLQYFH